MRAIEPNRKSTDNERIGNSILGMIAQIITGDE